MFKKITVFISSLILSILIMLPVTYVYASYKKGVLFFSAFLIAFLCSLVGFLIWHRFYKEKFEGFLAFCTIFLISTIFIYFGPVTLDRSLSSFIASLKLIQPSLSVSITSFFKSQSRSFSASS